MALRQCLLIEVNTNWQEGTRRYTNVALEVLATYLERSVSVSIGVCGRGSLG